MHCKCSDNCRPKLLMGSVFPECIVIGNWNQENLLLAFSRGRGGGLVLRAVDVRFRRAGSQLALLRVPQIDRAKQII